MFPEDESDLSNGANDADDVREAVQRRIVILFIPEQDVELRKSFLFMLKRNCKDVRAGSAKPMLPGLIIHITTLNSNLKADRQSLLLPADVEQPRAEIPCCRVPKLIQIIVGNPCFQ